MYVTSQTRPDAVRIYLINPKLTSIIAMLLPYGSEFSQIWCFFMQPHHFVKQPVKFEGKKTLFASVASLVGLRSVFNLSGMLLLFSRRGT